MIYIALGFLLCSFNFNMCKLGMVVVESLLHSLISHPGSFPEGILINYLKYEPGTVCLSYQWINGH